MLLAQQLTTPPSAPAPGAAARPPGRLARAGYQRDCSSPSGCPDAPRLAADGLPSAPALATAARPPRRLARAAFQQDCSSRSGCPDAPHLGADGVPPAPAPGAA